MPEEADNTEHKPFVAKFSNQSLIFIVSQFVFDSPNLVPIECLQKCATFRLIVDIARAKRNNSIILYQFPPYDQSKPNCA